MSARLASGRTTSTSATMPASRGHSRSRAAWRSGASIRDTNLPINTGIAVSINGTDRHCQSLARATGSRDRNWRAYLSTSASGGYPAVNARDRIGRGPWQNAKGVVVASNVDQLHGTNNLTKETALNEKGEMVNGRTEKPNTHDMLTGSMPDGRAITASGDSTCSNWTTSGAGAAMLGHHDRQGLRDDDASKSWNSSHLSRPTKDGAPGCSQAALQGTGGNGLFYCFAAN